MKIRDRLVRQHHKKGAHHAKGSKVHGKTPESRARQLANLKHRWDKGKLPVDPIAVDNDIIRWAEQNFYLAETRKPIVLLDHEKEFLRELFAEPVKNLAVLGQPKKTGKSTMAALIALYTLCNVGTGSEIYLLGPDQEQAELVIYGKIKKAVRLNKELRKTCKIEKRKITHRVNENFILAMACSSTNVGLAPTLTVFDELWRFTSQEAKDTWNELTNIPAEGRMNLNLVVSYAGRAEDEDGILHGLYKKGMSQQEDPKFLFRWHGEELYDKIPWVTESYLKSQKTRLHPAVYARLHQNEWVSGNEAFLEADIIDQCTMPERSPGMSFDGPVVVGVDAALKHDTSAVVVVGCQRDDEIDQNKALILIDHRCFVPLKGQTLDLASTVEKAILDFNKKYNVRRVVYDPFQMQRSAQGLRKAGLRVKEIPQTASTCTEFSELLLNLLTSRGLILYPDPVVRQHLLNTRVKQTDRGCRIVKGKASQKIDLAIALSMACLECQRSGITGSGRVGSVYVYGEDSDDNFSTEKFLEQRMGLKGI
jgi:Terminase large subunit, ATPase domain/Terminase large subunit, endonuclease domain